MANEHLQHLGDALKESVSTLISTKGAVNLADEPDVQVKDIIEYDSRMRVMGMEKFNGPCFVVAIGIFGSQKAMKSADAMGSLILFFEEGNAAKLLKAVNIRDFDEDDEDQVLEACARFSQMAAENLLENLKNRGYGGLVLSPAVKERNDIGGGVAFHFDELKFVEMAFLLWDQKILVANLTLAPA